MANVSEKIREARPRWRERQKNVEDGSGWKLKDRNTETVLRKDMKEKQVKIEEAEMVRPCGEKD